jgi:adenosylcobinamide-GDP ribazoletransferase
MTCSIFAFPSAKETGMGQIFKKEAKWHRLVLATGIALGLLIFLIGVKGIALLGAIWLITFALAGFLYRRLGGLTGDTYGAINEVAEVAILILIPFTQGQGVAQWLGYF